MIDAERYVAELIEKLKTGFGTHLLYVGLQGSYLRSEATDNSDIDIMVILDTLTAADLKLYRSIIQQMESFEKSCGFICAKEDIANWNPLEICNLLHGTKDYYGVLRDFVPSYDERDISNFIKLSINNLYHEICHRFIHADHAKNVTYLPWTYKGVFFILQNLYFLRHGRFVSTKAELLTLLEGKDRDVLECSLKMKEDINFDFDVCFTLLLTWCQETMKSL